MEMIETRLHSIEDALYWVPSWAISLVLFAIAICLARVLHTIAFRIVKQVVKDWDLFWRSLVSRTEGPTRMAAVTLAMVLVAPLAPLTTGQTALVQEILSICLIATLAWFAHTALHIWVTVYLRRFKLDADDNLMARKHVTQTRIMRRVANMLIYTIAFAACLMTFEGVRQYGVSLLASAGVAGIVLGLALQPVLKNLFAGIQLAITQPIRIDDALLVEGEWGNVEEITSTYVVIRIWDWRRLVLPLSYFIEQPFQNWTRESAALIGTVMIYLDYSVPVDVLRREVEAIAKASTLWDGRVVAVQVTHFRENVMEVRILVSATSSGRTFDLRCEVREKVIAFLQKNHPGAMPRLRAHIAPAADMPQMMPVPNWKERDGPRTPREPALARDGVA
ncbi:mechanosensitive ion channel family protein [Ancylobacter sp. 6x-1]|uniref:Mechanosensitive ion channel family protein n=1 Tax=Ancylobacter crimeensis TaxID=2579147 RepID=A0ABT0D816_9HYPH|nr:mechanosensitive ion channel family protein [Ancylobacter crimeensis]MCK0196085.1 mechanosensitive ion channel family protein [Ancylobacter crimeensis]